MCVGACSQGAGGANKQDAEEQGQASWSQGRSPAPSLTPALGQWLNGGFLPFCLGQLPRCSSCWSLLVPEVAASCVLLPVQWRLAPGFSPELQLVSPPLTSSSSWVSG